MSLAQHADVACIEAVEFAHGLGAPFDLTH
jgi:hypothetical protein